MSQPPHKRRRRTRSQTKKKAISVFPRSFPNSEQADITVTSFNILADVLAQRGGFSKLKSTPEVLEWEYRFPLLLQEVEQIGADVIGMCECNKFYESWMPAMRKLGYDAVFVRKHQAPGDRHHPDKDGAAIFFRTGRFSLLSSRLYSEFPVQAVALLADHEHKQRVVVSMHHLKAKPGFEELRQAQAETVTKRVKETIAEAMQARHKNMQKLDLSSDWNLSSIICGDFNCLQDEPCIETVQSASYTAADNLQTEWTTWKFRDSEVKRSIDFIFHDKKLRPVSILPPLKEPELDGVGLPHARYPSDHIAIAAKFQYVKSEK